jgi:asparagine synthase (glutamine-hydrolysing)
MQAAAKDGLKVVMTGEIADELFAGYDWYPSILKEHDCTELNKRMWQDLRLGYVEHFERENKMAEFFDLELSNPYSDENVIKTAMKISVDLKTEKNDIMGKFIHRIASEELDVPLSISWRVKEEVQYGSGVHDVVKHLAFNNGYYPDKKYKLNTKTKKLGSVYRYGNKYRPLDERFGNENVQKYFEDIAIELGITK